MDARPGSSSLPLLTPDAIFSEKNGDLVVETEDVSYTFHADSAKVLGAVKDHLDGSRTVAELAKTAGVSPGVLGEILATFTEEGLLLDVRAALDASTPEEFLKLYRRFCAFWSKEIFAQPFWPALISGRAPLPVVLGWGIEFFHYAEAAKEHMPTAVAYCRNDHVVRQWLAKHFAEEHSHGDLFVDGLALCGLDRDLVRSAPPLPSTRALINYLSELATTDTLAYAGGFGAMRSEADGGVDSLVRFYDDLTAHYGAATGILRAIQAHAALDAELGHEELVLERILTRTGRITPDAAMRILRGARGVVEHFVLYFEGIHDYYSAPGAQLPRRAADVRLMLR